MKRKPVFLRVIINLYFILNRLMIYPIFLLKKYFWLLLFFILAVSVFRYCSSKDEEEQKRVVPSEPAPVLIEPVKTKEDGNSKFATDMLKQMNELEVKYYSQVFYWVMFHQPAGEAYQWKYANIHGTITPSENFNNNRGDTCRRFNEVLKVKTIQQELDGIACRKGEKSWCKLRKSATPVCNIGSQDGFFDNFKRSLGDLF